MADELKICKPIPAAVVSLEAAVVLFSPKIPARQETTFLQG